MKTGIPSPARSQGGPVTPRRYFTRRTRSVGSPARSNASGRLSTLAQQLREDELASFVASPMNRCSVLSDNTDIEIPGRKSWWKKLNDTSGDVMIALHSEKVVEVDNVLEEYIHSDGEVLSQEKKDYSLDLPESSGSDTIDSIVLPQRKLFTQLKENIPEKRFGKVIGVREAFTKQQKSKVIEKSIHISPKKLFGENQPKKSVFPANVDIIDKNNSIKQISPQTKNIFGRTTENQKAAVEKITPPILNTTEKEAGEQSSETKSITKPVDKTKPTLPTLVNLSANKTGLNVTKELAATVQVPGRNLFGNRGGTKRKNIFADFKLDDSEEEIPEIQPKIFGFRRNPERRGSTVSLGKKDGGLSPTSSIATDIEMDDWNLLPSSTMIAEKNDDVAVSTPLKRMRLSKIDAQKENQIELVENNVTVNIMKQSKKILAYTSKTTADDPKAVDTEDEILTKNVEINKTRNMSTRNNSRRIIDDVNTDNITSSSKNKTSSSKNSDKSLVHKSKVTQDVSNAKNVNAKVLTDNIETNKSINKSIRNDSRRILDAAKSDNNGSFLKYESSVSLKNISKHQINHSEAKDNISVSQKYKDVTAKSTKVTNDIEDDEDINLTYEHDEEPIIENENDIDVLEEDRNNTTQNKAKCLLSKSQQESAEINERSKACVSHTKKKQIGTDKTTIQDIEGNVNALEQGNTLLEEMISDAESVLHDEVSDVQEHTASENEQVGKDNENSEDVLKKTMDQAELKKTLDEEYKNMKEKEHQDKVSEDVDNQNESGLHDEDHKEDEVVLKLTVTEKSEDENEQEEIEEQNQTKDQSEDDNDQDKEAPSEIENDDEDENDNQTELLNSEVAMEKSDEEFNEVEMSNSIENGHNNKQSVNLQEENDYAEAEVGQQSDNDIQDQQTDENQISANKTHDTTGRFRKHIKGKIIPSPEIIRKNISNLDVSYNNKGRNTSIRKTKSMIKPIDHKISIASLRESVGDSESSAQGSGWDSHRTTRKTIRQTFGKGYTPRKSLRALVMEQSAKRQTVGDALATQDIDIPQANSTEYGVEVSAHHDVEMEESDHEVSRANRLEILREKLKQVNQARKRKMETKIEESLKSSTRGINDLFKVPLKPSYAPRRGLKGPEQSKPKPKVKPSAVPLGELPAELIEELKYKPPKRFAPSNASWTTNRLYKFLEAKLEPKYDYKARVRAEKLMETLYNFTKLVRRLDSVSRDVIDELKGEMARLKVVRTHFDFYEFFHEFMPREIRTKVIPDAWNKYPLPRRGIYSDILTEDTMRG